MFLNPLPGAALLFCPGIAHVSGIYHRKQAAAH
jgi:hypothetical protein